MNAHSPTPLLETVTGKNGRAAPPAAIIVQPAEITPKSNGNAAAPTTKAAPAPAPAAAPSPPAKAQVKPPDPRGGHHLYFRNSGEHTAAKIDGRPIDVRGIGGFLVVAPGETLAGRYQFVRGSVDDLDRLPAIKPGALPMRPAMGRMQASPGDFEQLDPGSRNDSLFYLAMTEAHTCATVDELEGRAAVLNEARCNPPLPWPEVQRIVRSAWGYTVRGMNWVGGRRRLYVELGDADLFIRNPDALALLLILQRAHPDPTKVFAVSPHAMETAQTLHGWGHKKIRGARDYLVRVGKLERVKQGGGFCGASLFRFSAANLSGFGGSGGIEKCKSYPVPLGDACERNRKDGEQ